MDDLIKVPTLDELSSETEQSLIDSGFKVSNYRTGSVFKTLLMICLQGLVGLYQLASNVSAQCFLIGAKGLWLDVKAAEYGERRKEEGKAEGDLTASRSEVGPAVKIPKNLVIKTDLSSEGEELRYLTVTEVVLSESQLSVKVPVVAEKTGTKYNVPAGLIKNPIKNVPGIEDWTNESDWLTKEGTDKESDESLRFRCLSVWDSLATNMTSSAYKVVVSRINGVAVVNVDDQHPRGQGTVDVVVSGVAGEPTAELISEVEAAVEAVRGSYEDVQVFGAQAVAQDVTVTIHKDDVYGDVDSIRSQAEGKIAELFTINEDNNGTRLVLSTIVSVLRDIEFTKDVLVATPASNVTLAARQILTPGLITVNVISESEAV